MTFLSSLFFFPLPLSRLVREYEFTHTRASLLLPSLPWGDRVYSALAFCLFLSSATRRACLVRDARVYSCIALFSFFLLASSCIACSCSASPRPRCKSLLLHRTRSLRLSSALARHPMSRVYSAHLPCPILLPFGFSHSHLQFRSRTPERR